MVAGGLLNFFKIAQLVHTDTLGLSCITIRDTERIGRIDEGFGMMAGTFRLADAMGAVECKDGLASRQSL